MANFLLLYNGGGIATSETEKKAFLKQWETWFGKIGANLVDGGNPITPSARSITSDGKVSNVPAGSMVSGYSIIKADSLDAAVAQAKGCPVLRSGGGITVFEIHDAMEM